MVDKMHFHQHVREHRLPWCENMHLQKTSNYIRLLMLPLGKTGRELPGWSGN